jgi:hypothetical protein
VVGVMPMRLPEPGARVVEVMAALRQMPQVAQERPTRAAAAAVAEMTLLLQTAAQAAPALSFSR